MKKGRAKKTAEVLLIVSGSCIVLAVHIMLVMIGVFYLGMSVAIARNYSDIKPGDDGFEYLISDKTKKAGVYSFTFDPESGIDTIVIPEYFKDYPVKSLGGYIGRGGPCPFSIDVKAPGTQRETVYYDLKLIIGPNIREIYAFQGEESMCVVRLYVECDPDNPKFYSENGILYSKDGERVKGLLYWDQESG